MDEALATLHRRACLFLLGHRLGERHGAAAIVAPAVTSAAFSSVEKIPRDWRRRIAAWI